MVCRLRLTRQSWQPEVHKLTPPSPDPSWRFAPPIQKLSVPFLGPGFLDESGTLESKTLKRGARQASLLQGWPRWQHILRQIGDLEHQYYLRLFFWQIISRSVNACTLYNLGDMNVVECATLLRRWLVCSHISELRNVNTFTQSKTVKPNFTWRKTRKSRQFWH